MKNLNISTAYLTTTAFLLTVIYPDTVVARKRNRPLPPSQRRVLAPPNTNSFSLHQDLGVTFVDHQIEEIGLSASEYCEVEDTGCQKQNDLSNLTSSDEIYSLYIRGDLPSENNTTMSQEDAQVELEQPTPITKTRSHTKRPSPSDFSTTSPTPSPSATESSSSSLELESESNDTDNNKETKQRPRKLKRRRQTRRSSLEHATNEKKSVSLKKEHKKPTPDKFSITSPTRSPTSSNVVSDDQWLENLVSSPVPYINITKNSRRTKQRRAKLSNPPNVAEKASFTRTTTTGKNIRRPKRTWFSTASPTMSPMTADEQEVSS